MQLANKPAAPFLFPPPPPSPSPPAAARAAHLRLRLGRLVKYGEHSAEVLVDVGPERGRNVAKDGERGALGAVRRFELVHNIEQRDDDVLDVGVHGGAGRADDLAEGDGRVLAEVRLGDVAHGCDEARHDAGEEGRKLLLDRVGDGADGQHGGLGDDGPRVHGAQQQLDEVGGDGLDRVAELHDEHLRHRREVHEARLDVGALVGGGGRGGDGGGEALAHLGEQGAQEGVLALRGGVGDERVDRLVAGRAQVVLAPRRRVGELEQLGHERAEVRREQRAARRRRVGKLGELARQRLGDAGGAHRDARRVAERGKGRGQQAGQRGGRDGGKVVHADELEHPARRVAHDGARVGRGPRETRDERGQRARDDSGEALRGDVLQQAAEGERRRVAHLPLRVVEARLHEGHDGRQRRLLGCEHALLQADARGLRRREVVVLVVVLHHLGHQRRQHRHELPDVLEDEALVLGVADLELALLAR